MIGREFAAGDVVSLLPPDAARAAEAHLAALADRGFLRRLPDAGYSFRHVLVHEAVYRAAPKRLRADLHERFAARLGQGTGAAAELDELVGNHLEQAHALRTDLRVLDEHTGALAREAGTRLGAAGLRALRRGDIHAAGGLLERAVALLPAESPPPGAALRARAGAGRLPAAGRRGRSAGRGDRGRARRGRPEESSGARGSSSSTSGCAATRRRRRTPSWTRRRGGIPVFERAGDRRALGRAWLLAGFVHGGHRGDHAAWLEAAELALEHYRAVGWPTSTCVGEIAAALYWGATPVDAAALRCEELLDDETLDLPGAAYLRAFLGGLPAQHGGFDRRTRARRRRGRDARGARPARGGRHVLHAAGRRDRAARRRPRGGPADPPRAVRSAGTRRRSQPPREPGERPRRGARRARLPRRGGTVDAASRSATPRPTTAARS